MIKINDADEKKMIVAYQKLCGNCRNKTVQNLFTNGSIYAEWLLRWRDDFVVDGKCLKMWHQKFVVSANKHKQGLEPPECYLEYNKFINSVTEWLNHNYNIKQGMKRNRKKFADILIEHRKICVDKLVEQLKECNHLSDCELVYDLPEKTNKRFTELVSYTLMHNGENVFKGSYDEVADYIAKING